jgi:hypothetical protein
MKEKYTFTNILEDARRTFRNARLGADCPDLNILTEFSSGELIAEKTEQVSSHIAGCETCQMVVMRLEADQYFWNEMLEHDPETALSQALGRSGKKEIAAMIRRAAKNRATKEISSFVSQIKESMVAWASPLWQPMYAGQAVTAADVEVQEKRFEMEYGEYINLSCHWREEKDGQPYIDLSWQANLIQPARLWARFIDPENSSAVLTEILLGTELEGKRRIMANELNFNPGTDKWAIAIIVEEK